MNTLERHAVPDLSRRSFMYFYNNGEKKMSVHIYEADDDYYYAQIPLWGRPKDFLPKEIEKESRVPSYIDKNSGGYYKIRKDDPHLLERFYFRPNKKGIYKGFEVLIVEDLGHRFWWIRICVPSPQPIGDILLSQEFHYHDYRGKAGYWEGFIPYGDPELVIDPEEAVKTSPEA